MSIAKLVEQKSARTLVAGLTGIVGGLLFLSNLSLLATIDDMVIKLHVI